MLKRYCVTYVGDDSCKHSENVWAKDHHEAKKKIRADGVEMITGVKKLANPFVVAFVVLALLALVVVQLLH